MNRTSLLVASIALGALASSAGAQVRFANFDNLPEGSYGPVFQENGFTFFDLDQDNGNGPGASFNLDDFSITLSGEPAFGPPNCLDWGALSVGGIGTVGRIKRLRISTPWPSERVQVLLFVLPSLAAGNTITMQAHSNGVIVDTDNRVIQSSAGYVPITMVVDGASIDEVRIIGSGPSQNGAFFACIDRVRADAQPVGAVFCLGDGTNGLCPCGNEGAAGQGCKNTSGQGATMEAFGSTSLSDDSMIVTGAGMPNSVPALLFSGPADIGAGLPLGDGLRCVGGSIRRVEVRFTSASGAVAYDDQVLSTAGWAPGVEGKWQIWFRDPSGFCGSGFSTSQGLKIVTTP